MHMLKSVLPRASRLTKLHKMAGLRTVDGRFHFGCPPGPMPVRSGRLASHLHLLSLQPLLACLLRLLESPLLLAQVLAGKQAEKGVIIDEGAQLSRELHFERVHVDGRPRRGRWGGRELWRRRTRGRFGGRRRS